MTFEERVGARGCCPGGCCPGGGLPAPRARTTGAAYYLRYHLALAALILITSGPRLVAGASSSSAPSSPSSASAAAAAAAAAARDTSSQFIQNVFAAKDSQFLNHLEVDKTTGTVYAGGVDRLYQLDPDLRLLQKVVTGPVNDSVDCSAVKCDEGAQATVTETRNANKVLVIDYTQSRLIVCGTIHQGACEVRGLRNISIVKKEVREAIVANNVTASTVAFIAPGPPNPPVTHVLYIGVTYTGKTVYRDEVPAVSSRSLEDKNFFDVAFQDVTTSTRMYVNSLARERYPINYVYGFGSEKFSYFLTRQMKETTQPSPYISKLVRVCQNDTAYYSYTEIPIECKDSNGTRYNLAQAAYVGKPGTILATQLGIQTNDDVLFAVFSPSDEEEGEMSPKPAKKSALCVYSMKSVRRMFINNIQECFRGKGVRGLSFISPSHRCILTRINDLNEDFCGMDVNTPLGGEQPVEGLSVLTFPTLLTSIAATSTGVYTVVFLGTYDGHLKKVVIENQKKALEYGDIIVDEGSEVNKDMHFDKSRDHLYVMTKKKISKVKAQECSIYEGCNQCLGARDPYCGWCSLENKCSLRRDCRDATQDPQHWVSYQTGRCTTITQVMPHQLQRTTARTLSLTIDNLPSVDGNLQCVFSAMGKELSTEAKRTAQGVSCTTPRNDMLPDIPHNEHHFTANLSVRKEKGPEFVSTNFTFFDCNTYSSCTDCVSSPFPCDWCVDGHRCTHDSAENCRNDVLVNGVNRVGPSIRSGPSFCPRITFVESKEILVPSVSKRSIKVKVDNIAQFITQTRFVCQFNIEGRVTSVDANLVSDTIYCDIMEFSYTTSTPSTNASFAVIWGGSKPLDNPDNIHVLVYKCHLMASNCGMCLSLAERYRCGWCQSTRRCEVQEQCASGSWLDREQTCPNITITSFTPQSGPWEGGTNVTIQGINLGKHIDDIYEGITVAGINCQPYRNSYVKTREVTCIVDGPGINEYKEGPIVVKVAQEYRGESKLMYKFVNPVIKGLSPKSGPKSGGTLLSIMGQHMNAGSSITAFINALPCHIQSTNATVATCVTSAAENLVEEGILRMKFDNGGRKLEDQFFSYVEDPTVNSVKSGRLGFAGLRDGPRGIPSGGIVISVNGTNFKVIQEPKMYVKYKDINYTSPCVVKNNTHMECRTPKIPVSQHDHMSPEEGLSLEYGFIMDSVNGVKQLNDRESFRHFLLFPDPKFHKFEDEKGVRMAHRHRAAANLSYPLP